MVPAPLLRTDEGASPPTGSSRSRASRSPTARSRSATTGGSRPSAPPPSSATGERVRGCVIVPGLRQLPLAPRVRGLRRLRRRAAVLVLDRAARRAQAAARPRRDARDRDATAPHECLRSGITTVGDCSFAGAAAEAAAETGLRAIVYLEVFGRDGMSALERASSELRERVEPRALRPRPARRLAARALHVHARALRGVRRARPAGRDPPRGERRRARLPRRRLRRLVGVRRACSCRRPGRPGSACSRRPGCSAPDVMAAHCVDVDARGDRAARRAAASASRTARARTGCSAAGSRRSRSSSRPGSRSGIATDSPASTPSFDLFEELRTAIVAARARERRPDALTAAAGPRARHPRRRARARPRRARSARSCPASGPT